ncbi:hypothetical protein ACIHAR_01105 [Streptomyces sp. NPDC052016]|jgi:uncharacterized protein YraI|uniref:hypothetical protein n=1 Tax=unclassified Streptomyces TaxID=2593676 RepID=UPI003694C64E
MTGSPTKRLSRLRRTAFAAAAACGAGLSLVAAAPSPQAADTTRVYVWASDVNMRACSSFSCPPYSGIKVSRMNVTAYCQSTGDTVRDGQYVNNYWVQVDAGGPRGWISAVYVSGGVNWGPIPGVSENFEDCF